MPDDPVERLANTHRRMGEELTALEQAARTGDRQRLDEALDFFASAAKRHHADEEASLFPRLQGDASLAPLLDALTAEHREHDVVRTEIEGLTRADAPAETIAARVDAFVAMVRAHLEREDRELLPAAERALDVDAKTAVAMEMRARRGGGRPG